MNISKIIADFLTWLARETSARICIYDPKLGYVPIQGIGNLIDKFIQDEEAKSE